MKSNNENDHPFLVLDAGDPDFIAKFADAIGAKPGDTIEISTPRFDRDDGVQPALSIDDWDRIRLLSLSSLKALGCRPWDAPDSDGNVLMLFPAEWYTLIPDGLRITCIDGEDEVFVRGESDDDKRYGVLAYGIKIKGD